jgi:CheY-like chemotaxis protein
MERAEFSTYLHGALANIFDYAVLEKHHLNEIVPRVNPSISKSENLRNFIRGGIEALKPNDKPTMDSIEWRYYHILYGRYVEGLSISELEKSLSLGERQIRRLHGRAIDVLEEILWDRLATTRLGVPELGSGPGHLQADKAEEVLSFPVSLGPLNLSNVLDDIIRLFGSQFRAHGLDFSVELPATLPMVLADRIILRQILLHVLNRIHHNWFGTDLAVTAHPDNSLVLLEIQCRLKTGYVPKQEDLFENKLFAYWIERLNARLQIVYPDRINASADADDIVETVFELGLPKAKQAKILIVDDHEPAIRIVQRYLSQTNVQAVGIHDPSQILSTIQTIHPHAVLLDVMMPAIDGWEILQKIKSDPETNHLPVIVCSIWDEPDLAYSLGADAFLKKPILQAQMLDELLRLGLLET